MARVSFRKETSMGKPRGPCRNQNYDRGSPSKLSHSSTSYTLPSFSPSAEFFSAPRHQGVHSSFAFTEVYPQDQFSSTPTLLTSFCSPQEGWSQPSYYRPVFPQYTLGHPYLQNGEGLGNSFLYYDPYVGLHSRPTGCVLPRPSGLVLPRIPCLHSGWPDLCLSGPSLWPFYSPMGVLKDHKTYQSSPSSSPPSFPYISGRLPSPCSYQGSPSGTHFLHHLSSTTTRSPYPLQEVSSQPLPVCRVPGGGVPSGQPASLSSQLQGSEDHVIVPGHGPQVGSFSPPAGELGGPSQLRVLLRPTGPSKVKASDQLDECTDFGRVEGCRGILGLRGEVPPAKVEGRVVFKDSCSNVPSSAHLAADDRCIQVRLGRCIDSPFHLGDLAGRVPVLFSELARTTGDLSITSTLSSTSQGQLCPNSLRQFNSGGLHTTPGYSKVTITYGSDHGSSRVLHGTLHMSHPQTPQWLSKCIGRPRVSSQPHLHGMVLGRENSCLGLLPDRCASSRPLCHEGQSSTSSVRLTLPGPGSSGGERIFDSLAPLGLNLPLSPCSSSSQSLVSSSTISRSGDPHCSLLCSVKLAPQPSQQVSGSHSSSSISFSVAENQQRPRIPSESFSVSATRVETIRRGLLAAGFNPAAADVYLLSHKSSSTRQYQSVWAKFLSFLSRNSISFRDTSVGVVCNFLTYEATVNNMQYRTVTGYRSALRLPLYWSCGLEIRTGVSDQFLRGLYNMKPPVKSAPMPVWNINILLSYLQTGRFEPLDSTSFLSITQKTLCLLLLSSGRRISEIANVSRSHCVGHAGRSLSLDWVPGFSPKHDDPGFRPASPSISFLASDLSTDLSLCPVRAYNIYLSVSQVWLDQLEPQDRHPFLWVQPGNKLQLSIRQLSNMFIKVVKDALREAGLPLGIKIGPHQMRKLGASLSHKVGQDEDHVRKVMGFSSMGILRKNYIADVPSLNIACVLPGGPYFPRRGTEISDTDSDD